MEGQALKAWKVYIPDQWCSLVHAETRGKAIVQVRCNVSDFEEYIDFRAQRLPGLDDRPITYQNAKDAGFEYLDEYNFLLPEDWFTNDCHCEICETGERLCQQNS